MQKIRFSYPQGRFPRLCLIGNSNVGKSSLTKLILSNPSKYKGKIGKTAGSTVRLTIINDPSLKHHVIDLPGFGKMVHLSKAGQAFIQRQILQYIEIDKDNIFLMLLVVSAERLDEELDKWFYKNQDTIPLTIEFLQYLKEMGVPTAIVINKCDKVNVYKRASLQEKIRDVLSNFDLEVGGNNPDILQVFETSAKKKEGIDVLKRYIRRRADRLDFKKYDTRSTLKDQPSIDKIYKYELWAAKQQANADRAIDEENFENIEQAEKVQVSIPRNAMPRKAKPKKRLPPQKSKGKKNRCRVKKSKGRIHASCKRK